MVIITTDSASAESRRRPKVPLIMDALEHTPAPEGADPGRLLLVVTWEEKGEWYLYRQLLARFSHVAVLQPLSGDRPQPAIVAALAGRLRPGLLALRAFVRRRRFDVVCSWSMPVGVCYGLLNRLVGGNASPRHILRDFHVSMVRTDWRYRLRLALLRCALPGIDAVLCTSREEEHVYARTFAIAPRRILFFPDVPPSQFLKVRPSRSASDYIFACGNSDRDFDTLIEAVQGLGHAAVILSQQFRPRKPVPASVRVVSRRVSVHEMQSMIQGARVVVVPLEHYQVAAGQNSMLEAMALGRPVIVTENFATREYARHGHTALLYPAGNSARLAQLLQQVFDDSGAAEAMAVRGREAALALLDEQVLQFIDIVRRYGRKA